MKFLAFVIGAALASPILKDIAGTIIPDQYIITFKDGVSQQQGNTLV